MGGDKGRVIDGDGTLFHGLSLLTRRMRTAGSAYRTVTIQTIAWHIGDVKVTQYDILRSVAMLEAKWIARNIK
jgi:hypothetical protein